MSGFNQLFLRVIVFTTKLLQTIDQQLLKNSIPVFGLFFTFAKESCKQQFYKHTNYALFAKEDGSVTVNIFLKVRTNLYAYDKLATIILMIGFLGIILSDYQIQSRKTVIKIFSFLRYYFSYSIPRKILLKVSHKITKHCQQTTVILVSPTSYKPTFTPIRSVTTSCV